MAIFTGLLQPNYLLTDRHLDKVPVNRTERALTRTLNQGFYFPYHGPLGTVVNTQPVSENATLYSGLLGLTSFDNFFGKIHITPAALEMGNVLSTQARQVEVYNSFAVPVTVTSFLAFSDEGLGVEVPALVPYAIPAYASVLYTFTITPEGPAVINASYQWIIDAVTYSLTVTGQRVVVFPYQPNWADKIIDRYQWLTSIFIARDGTEQRVTLRQWPRFTSEVGYVLFRHQLATTRNFLVGWQNRLAAVPLWQHRERLLASAPAGSSSISVNTTRAAFQAGHVLIIWLNASRYETAEIAAVGSGSVTLASPLTASWNAGASVVPGMFARLREQPNISALNEGAAKIKLTWQADPTDFSPWLPADAAPATFSGREVLVDAPNWRDGLQDTVEIEAAYLDFNTGAVVETSGRSFFRSRKAFNKFLKGRESIGKYLAQLRRTYGRRVAFYAPTFRRDFEVLGDMTTGSNAILVSDTDDGGLIRSAGAHTHVEIVFKNNVRLRLQIVSVIGAGDGTATLSVSPNFTDNYKAANVLRASYLQLSRMAEDDVSITWHSEDVAESEFAYTEIKQ